MVGHDLGVGDIYCAFYPHKLENGERILTDWDRSRGEVYEQIGQDFLVLRIRAVIERDKQAAPQGIALGEGEYR